MLRQNFHKTSANHVLLPIKKFFFFFVTKPSHIKPTNSRRADTKIVSNLISISRIPLRELSFFLSFPPFLSTQNTMLAVTSHRDLQTGYPGMCRGGGGSIISLSLSQLVNGLTDERRSVTSWQRWQLCYTARSTYAHTYSCARARGYACVRCQVSGTERRGNRVNVNLLGDDNRGTR